MTHRTERVVMKTVGAYQGGEWKGPIPPPPKEPSGSSIGAAARRKKRAK